MDSRLFLHKAELRKLQGFDADRNKMYSDAIGLEKVRVAFSTGVAQGAHGAEAGDSLTLFFMNGLSEPQGTEFGLGDKVVFGGREFFVQGITPFYTDKDTPHHWEISLK